MLQKILRQISERSSLSKYSRFNEDEVTIGPYYLTQSRDLWDNKNSQCNAMCYDNSGMMARAVGKVNKRKLGNAFTTFLSRHVTSGLDVYLLAMLTSSGLT